MILSTFYNHIADASAQNGLSLSQVAEKCLSWGITGIDIETEPYREHNNEFLTLLDAGMQLNSLPTRCDFFHHPEDLSIAMEAVEIVRKYHGKQILIIPGYLLPGDDLQKCLENCIKPIQTLVDEAAKYGIEVGMEDYDHEAYPYGRQSVMLWFMEHVPRLSCIFDTGNFLFHGEDAGAAYPLLKKYIKGQIHCKDRKLVGREGESGSVALNGKTLYPAAVGSGILPMKEIISDLLQSGYNGSFTLEFFGSADCLSDLEASAKFIHSLV